MSEEIRPPQASDSQGAEQIFQAAAEQQAQPQQSVEQQSDTRSVEEQAREQGWSPDGELSADEFVRRGSLFKKIHSQTAQIRELKDTLNKLSSHVESSEKAAYDRALAQLKDQRDNAILSGDLDTVRTIEKQAEVLQQKQQQPMLPPTRQFSAEEIEFAERNKSWLNTDPANSEIVHEALAFDTYLVNNRKDLNDTQRLQLIEEKLRRIHPDKFSNPKKFIPAAVATSSGGNKETGTSRLINRMSAQQRAIGEQFSRLVPGYSLEKYAQELDRQGNLGK